MAKHAIEFVGPDKFSVQKLYLGEEAFRGLNLNIGDLVKLNDHVIARCFLHRIRELDFLTCQNGATILKTDNILLNQRNNFHNSIYAGDIVKLKLVKAHEVTIVIIGSQLASSDVQYPLKDILRSVCFVDNTLVRLEENTVARMYNIVAVRLTIQDSDPEACYEIDQDTVIKISKVWTSSYIDLISRNILVPAVAGVEEIYSKLLKVARQRSQHILLSGPAGCGKSCLTGRVAADLGYPLVSLDCSDIGSRTELLVSAFDKAREVATQNSDNPGAMLLLKDVENIGGRKGIQQMQGISTLVQLLENHTPGKLIKRNSNSNNSSRSENNIIVIATTAKPQEVDGTLRRPGRLGFELFMKVPTQCQRSSMLQCISNRYQLELTEETREKLAQATRGFLASDLNLLVKRIMMSDTDDWGTIQKCLDITTPSGLKLGLGCVNLEKISWQSIGGMDEIKTKLMRAIEWPIKKPEAFKRLGIKPSKGVLLYGPPGCGKTRLVRAAASNIGATLLSVSGAEIYSPYVGDSEKAIVELFRQARLGAPTILFIDEIDTLVAARDTEGTKASHSDKVLSALLTEMDGMGGKEQESFTSGQVLVVGATNRPGNLDGAMTRPGRLDTLLFVPPPDIQTRIKILETYLRGVPNKEVDIESIAERTENYSGADLENLVKESVLQLLSEVGMSAECLTMENIERVLETFRPSLGSRIGDYKL